MEIRCRASSLLPAPLPCPILLTIFLPPLHSGTVQHRGLTSARLMMSPEKPSLQKKDIYQDMISPFVSPMYLPAPLLLNPRKRKVIPVSLIPLPMSLHCNFIHRDQETKK